jgi:ribosomal protein S18 acetylase RimI-like enzyme
LYPRAVAAGAACPRSGSRRRFCAVDPSPRTETADPAARFERPTPLDSIEYRPLHLTDAPDVFALIRDCRVADDDPDETTFTEFLHSTFHWFATDPAHDTIGALDADGRLVGYGWTFAREGATRTARVWLHGGVHPRHRRRGIGRRILRHGITRAGQVLASRPSGVPGQIDVDALPHQADRIALFASEGFRPVRSFVVMHRPLEDAIPAAPLPAALTAVDWRADLDGSARDAHNEAFTDHWGSEPVSAERWSHLASSAPGFRGDLSSLAVTPDGEIAGYVLCAAPPGMQAQRPTAWIGTVGVRRRHRRHGVAAALLTRSMTAMQRAGFEVAGLDVDAENPTGAVRVYERLGFATIREQRIFSRTVEV